MENERQALIVNDEFYRAFNERSAELMSRVWCDDPLSTCIHPGWPALQGYSAILQSWKDIFTNARDMEIKTSHVEVVASADLVWVSCRENVFSIHAGGVQASKVHATNLFRRADGEWKMVLHHASALPPQAETENFSLN
jgi:ketosteroid isomerase-like protein